MLKIVFERFGEPREVLKISTEEPTVPRAGEVLVRIRKAVINPADLMIVRGIYNSQLPLPATPGLEGMGVVERLGEGVSGLDIGQRVIPKVGLIGNLGTWQEYITVDARELIPVPDRLGDGQAAQFISNPLSAFIMLNDELCLQPGDWLLQTAAGSTLGRIVVQLARVRGLKLINIVRRREQVEELRALGCNHVICQTDENIFERVMEITDNAGVPAAIDAVGGSVGSEVARSLSAGGTMLVYGILSMMPLSLDGADLIFKSTAVRGFLLPDWYRRASATKRQQVVDKLMRLMVDGEVVAAVEAEYQINDLISAIERAERPGRCGKILLTC